MRCSLDLLGCAGRHGAMLPSERILRYSYIIMKQDSIEFKHISEFSRLKDIEARILVGSGWTFVGNRETLPTYRRSPAIVEHFPV